jgi:hypothetical protein
VKISSREKRFIIIGIVIAVAVAIFYVLMSLPDSDISGSLKKQEEKLKQQLDTLTREPIYQQKIEQYKKRFEQDKTLLLSGDNPTVAGAELLKVLKDFADQTQVNITTRSNPAPENKKDVMLTKVSARIDTTCDIENLVQFLCAIQSYPKYLKIDEMTINSFRMPVQKKYEIRPTMIISGYINMREEKQIEKPAAPARPGGRASL